MAIIIPDLKGVKLPKLIAPICQRIKAIRCDDIVCRLALPVSGKALPEIFLLYKEKHAFLISISAANTEDIETQLQGNLFKSANHDLFREEFGLNQRQLLDDCYNLILKDWNKRTNVEISRWILFPNARRTTLDQAIQVLSDDNYTLFAKEDCTTETLFSHIKAAAKSGTPDQALKEIRSLYGSAELAPIQVKETKSNYGPSRDIFLDLDQEWLVKIDLDLSEEGKAIFDSSNRLVTGSAGSGKSVILLHRARLLSQMNPHYRILSLTHNRPLNDYLSSRFGTLAESASIEWRTFFSWIGKHAKGQINTLSTHKRSQLISELLNASTLKGRLNKQFISDEFDWLTNHDVTRKSEYIEINRTGRKRPLQGTIRSEIFDLYLQYRRTLLDRNMCDWPGFAQRFLHQLRSNQAKIPEYDAILIDEAQFFVPVWFECVRKALKPNGHLFMAADPTQGFLGSGQSWQQFSGFDIRGKSHNLSRPYRNTQAILSFAANFYQTRVPDDDENVNIPLPDQIAVLPKGTEPQLIRFSNAQDQIHWVSKKILQELSKGSLLTNQILILHEESEQVQHTVRLLNRLRPETAADAKDKGNGDKIRVCSFNAATGLEAPLVFILGIDQVFAQESDLSTDPADKPEHILRNTRKIYMTLTRAMNELIICYTQPESRNILLGK